ncbi:melanoma-associated antigen 10-like [Loxodonta africana]|uniref:melanoma-associated antigen 10-like n=1 Tax=Loxodonta africana TaxID=9785 RepID=UPI000223623E|nr:melanoma-associated antigen 10-like [Loxodonta africana]XP_049728982.1 melanoma-associated antigen 10-like [Elephas maximus indicus]
MSHAPKHQHYTLEQDHQAQTEAQGLVAIQVPAAEEDSCSSSFNLSFLSSFSCAPNSSPSSPKLVISSSPCSSSSSFHFSYFSSSSSCSSPQNLGTQDEVEVPTAVVPSTHQSPQKSFSISTSTSISDEDSSSPEEEKIPSTSQASVGAESSSRDPLEDTVTDLVQLLLLRYQMRQPITKVEMLKVMSKRSKNQFPVIFKKACECLEMVFGINVKEVGPPIHSYVLVNSLDLTYDEVVINGQGMPKNGLLIIILGVIFLEGNRIPEEDIWELLNIMGVYAGSEHAIYGEPRQLITRDWVQEKYLEYQEVPNSDPARYEFLWGPRAHAETSKMKVLEFLAKLNGTDPSSFSPWYEEALRDEQERAQARIALTGSATEGLLAQCGPAAFLPRRKTEADSSLVEEGSQCSQ